MTNQPSEFFIKSVNKGLFPHYLYKYRAINDNTIKTIAENKLFFSNPYNFNDPYDCNVSVERNSSEEEIRKWGLRLGANKENIDWVVKQIKADPEYVQKIIMVNLSRCGICCFSTIFDSILMWSHYADYHKGICLKFDVTKDPDLFNPPLEVKYSRVLPHYDHFISDKEIFFEKFIQTKYADWSYESEFRIFKTEEHINRNKSRIFKFKNEALTEIIFGTNTSEEDIKIIKKLCEKSGKNHVKFSKMKLKEGIHYRLEKVDL